MTKIIHRMAEERRQEDGLAVAIRFDRVQCWSAHWSCPWKNMVLSKKHLTRTLLANWYWKKIEGKTNSNHSFIRTLLTCGVCGLSLAPPSVIYRLGFFAHKLFVTTSITLCIFVVYHLAFLLSRTLPPERTQPQKLCTANFSSGTLKTLINRLLRLKNKIFWRDPCEKKPFFSRLKSESQKYILK